MTDKEKIEEALTALRGKGYIAEFTRLCLCSLSSLLGNVGLFFGYPTRSEQIQARIENIKRRGTKGAQVMRIMCGMPPLAEGARKKPLVCRTENKDCYTKAGRLRRKVRLIWATEENAPADKDPSDDIADSFAAAGLEVLALEGTRWIELLPAKSSKAGSPLPKSAELTVPVSSIEQTAVQNPQ